ncbi:MAG: pyruvate ferredoxin oxidoreductase [Candidatus Verstraetearchaeota archaeon]|nr:pyruvate ferredoxin oxidoreductase [Candidatus Verstraetearchaeota archaeon]
MTLRKSVEVLTGNYAVAYGVKLARAEIIAAYPITPQTSIVEKLSEFIENGEMEAEYIRVESEHSAMAACIGAASAGARAFTATSSHGLLYMAEMVFWAGYSRLPIVMAVVTRTLAPPWNIWSEHTDIFSLRDAGWIIFMCEDNQEVLDTVIQAYKIAEDPRVQLPVMLGLDAFTLSHVASPVELPSQEEVDSFLPPPGATPRSFTMDVEHPISHSSIVDPDTTFQFRYLMKEAMEEAKEVIREVDKAYSRLTGRRYGGLAEEYRCSDAELILVVAGAAAGDAKEAADMLRDEGIKAGVLKIRALRPFPVEEARRVASSVKALLTFDREYSFGSGGVIAHEVKASLYGFHKQPLVDSYIVGLGGSEITSRHFMEAARRSLEKVERGILKPGEVWLLPPEVKLGGVPW